MLAFTGLGAPSAFAHAIVLTSVPTINTSMRGPAIPIQVHFNSRIDQARSRLLLIAPNGAETVLKLDPTSSPDTLTAQADSVAPGAYRLRWLVLAVDGHITRGDIPFKVTGP